MTMKDRVEKAVELFKSGYNCSQSVVAAFADMYGFTQEQALRMSALVRRRHRTDAADAACRLRHVPAGGTGERCRRRQGS